MGSRVDGMNIIDKGHTATRESPESEAGPLHVDQLPIVRYNSFVWGERNSSTSIKAFRS